MSDETEDTGGKQKRQGDHLFRPGESGNPNGRPAGARSRVTALAQRMMDADAEAVIAALLKAAKGGDTTAIRMVLERVAPTSRNRLVWFDVPPIDTAADVGDALNAVLRAASGGELAPDEAVSIASLIETRRRTLETLELEARIAALEQSKEAGR